VPVDALTNVCILQTLFIAFDGQWNKYKSVKTSSRCKRWANLVHGKAAKFNNCIVLWIVLRINSLFLYR
jgi:hypothetical protein